MHQGQVDGVEHSLPRTWSAELPGRDRKPDGPAPASNPFGGKHHGATPPRFGQETGTDTDHPTAATRGTNQVDSRIQADEKPESVAWQRGQCSRRRIPAGRGEQPGTKTVGFQAPVGGDQPKVRLVGAKSRELAAPALGRLVEAVQNHGVAGRATLPQPLGCRAVGVESVAVFQTGSDEQRHRDTAGVEQLMKFVEVAEGPVVDLRHRDDQPAGHGDDSAEWR